MNLADVQRAMFDVVREPLTATEQTRRRIRDGRLTRQIADTVIKPNDRLTSLERLEIYNRQYWFRILSSFQDDFPGLRAILGPRRFERLAVAYLADCPSRSFTLRNLGSRLPQWLQEHAEFTTGAKTFALDMARLEWAEIEAFDGEARPVVGEQDLAQLGPDPCFHLQPYVQLLDLSFPAHEWLLKVRRRDLPMDTAVNAASVSQKVRRSRRPPFPSPAATHLAVHRMDDSVYFKILEPAAFQVLKSLERGERLSTAIERLEGAAGDSEDPLQRLHKWFRNWAQLGWFCKEAPQSDEHDV